ncbi:MAG: metal ABC transporter ATP-binding protein [Burkholderiaceae bacterium]
MVRLDDLTVAFRRHPALHHISGQFAKGSLTAVTGPNGAGKSTLLKSILGLLPLTSGSVKIAPDLRRIAYLPQQSEIDRSFPILVRDCVLLGYWQRVGQFGMISAALMTQAESALSAVGLEGFSQRAIGSLSAGQFQRVLFARILLQDADLILLDEPFNAIDSKTTTELLHIVASWHQEGRTVIAVLHDHAQVRCYFPQTLLLARNVIAWGDTATVMTDDYLRHAKVMAEAWDENAPLCEVGVRAA